MIDIRMYEMNSMINKLTYALPFAHPAIFWAHHSNQTIEIVARTIVHIVFVVFHPQEFFTIITTIHFELIE